MKMDATHVKLITIRLQFSSFGAPMLHFMLFIIVLFVFVCIVIVTWPIWIYLVRLCAIGLGWFCLFVVIFLICSGTPEPGATFFVLLFLGIVVRIVVRALFKRRQRLESAYTRQAALREEERIRDEIEQLEVDRLHQSSLVDSDRKARDEIKTNVPLLDWQEIISKRLRARQI